MEGHNGTDPAVSQRVGRFLQVSGPIMRFLMQPRDLGHPEACDFLAGNPQEPAMPAYVAAVQRAMVPDSPSYYAYGPPFRGAIDFVTRALSERLDLELDPQDVFLTRGAASGLQMALRAVVDPGEDVVFLSPPWFFYESMLVELQAQPVRVSLAPPRFDLDPEAIGRALTPRTRAVIVNTPHNPTGRIYPESQLRALAEVLERASQRNRRRIYLLSDEAYARILFDGNRMVTPGRFYPATFMLHTYSKSLLAPSQRAGYLAMPPSMPDRERLRLAMMAVSMAGGAIPDTGMQRAMPELERLMIDLAGVERRRDRMVAELRRQGYQVKSPEGTFYLLPQSPIPDSSEFCDWLAERRIYALPGEAVELPGYLRLSLTATDAMVDRALPVFEAAIRQFSPARPA